MASKIISLVRAKVGPAGTRSFISKYYNEIVKDSLATTAKTAAKNETYTTTVAASKCPVAKITEKYSAAKYFAAKNYAAKCPVAKYSAAKIATKTAASCLVSKTTTEYPTAYTKITVENEVKDLIKKDMINNGEYQILHTFLPSGDLVILKINPTLSIEDCINYLSQNTTFQFPSDLYVDIRNFLLNDITLVQIVEQGQKITPISEEIYLLFLNDGIDVHTINTSVNVDDATPFNIKKMESFFI